MSPYTVHAQHKQVEVERSRRLVELKLRKPGGRAGQRGNLLGAGEEGLLELRVPEAEHHVHERAALRVGVSLVEVVGVDAVVEVVAHEPGVDAALGLARRVTQPLEDLGGHRRVEQGLAGGRAVDWSRIVDSGGGDANDLSLTDICLGALPFWLVNLVPALLGVSLKVFAVGTESRSTGGLSTPREGRIVAPFFTEGLEGFNVDDKEDWERAEPGGASLAAPLPDLPRDVRTGHGERREEAEDARGDEGDDKSERKRPPRQLAILIARGLARIAAHEREPGAVR